MMEICEASSTTRVVKGTKVVNLLMSELESMDRVHRMTEQSPSNLSAFLKRSDLMMFLLTAVYRCSCLSNIKQFVTMVK